MRPTREDCLKLLHEQLTKEQLEAIAVVAETAPWQQAQGYGESGDTIFEDDVDATLSYLAAELRALKRKYDGDDHD